MILKVNVAKSKVLNNCSRDGNPQMLITVLNDEPVEQVAKFCYLGIDINAAELMEGMGEGAVVSRKVKGTYSITMSWSGLVFRRGKAPLISMWDIK